MHKDADHNKNFFMVGSDIMRRIYQYCMHFIVLSCDGKENRESVYMQIGNINEYKNGPNIRG